MVRVLLSHKWYQYNKYNLVRKVKESKMNSPPVTRPLQQVRNLAEGLICSDIFNLILDA